MGSVRSFTPTGTIPDSDDQAKGPYSFGFTFWGWSEGWISTNGLLSFTQFTDLVNGNTNDAGYFYCYSEPLDYTLPDTDNIVIFGWENYRIKPVALYPFSTDYGRSLNDVPAGIQEVFYGNDTIDGKEAFLVTWKDMFVYDMSNQNGDVPTTIRNTFQVVIYDDDTFEFNYDKIEFTNPYWWFPGLDSNWHVNALAGYRLVHKDDYDNDLNDSDHHIVDEFPFSRAVSIVNNGDNGIDINNFDPLDPNVWFIYQGLPEIMDSGATPLSVQGRWILPVQPLTLDAPHMSLRANNAEGVLIPDQDPFFSMTAGAGQVRVIPFIDLDAGDGVIGNILRVLEGATCHMVITTPAPDLVMTAGAAQLLGITPTMYPRLTTVPITNWGTAHEIYDDSVPFSGGQQAVIVSTTNGTLFDLLWTVSSLYTEPIGGGEVTISLRSRNGGTEESTNIQTELIAWMLDDQNTRIDNMQYETGWNVLGSFTGNQTVVVPISQEIANAHAAAVALRGAAKVMIGLGVLRVGNGPLTTSVEILYNTDTDSSMFFTVPLQDTFWDMAPVISTQAHDPEILITRDGATAEIDLEAGAGEIKRYAYGATSSLLIQIHVTVDGATATLTMESGAGITHEYGPAVVLERTRSGSVATPTTLIGLAAMDGVWVEFVTTASLIYRPPVRIPTPPVTESIIPADPEVATGFIIRPYFGMNADPAAPPVIVDGRPT